MAAFQHGYYKGAVPFDNSGSPEPVNDQRLMRSRFAEHAGDGTESRK